MKKTILALIVAGLLLGGGLTWALLPTQVQATDNSTTTTNPTTTATPTSQSEIPALTDAQKQQLQDLEKSWQESEKALQDQLQTARQQLKDALLANPTDTAKLQQAQSTILSLEDQLATSRTDFALKAKEITGGVALGPLGPDRKGPKGCGERMGDRLDRLYGGLNPQDKTQTGTGPEQSVPPDFPQMKDQTTTGTMPQRPPDPDLSNLKDELGLTDAQITQLKDLRTSTASAMQQLRDPMQTAEKDLRDAIQAVPTDNAKLQTAQTTLSNLRVQQLQAQVNAALQAKQIVGPDIFAKAVEQFGRLIDFLAPFQMGQRPDKGIGLQAPQPTGTNSTLTDTQKQQLQDLRQQEQDSAQALSTQLKDAAQQLKDALLANPTDMAKLQQAQSTILSLESQLAQIRNDFRIQVQQIAGADAFQTMEGRFGRQQQIQALDRQINRLEQKQDRLERIQDHPGMINEIQQNLGLTADQLQQLKDLRASAQTKMEPIQTQMQTAQETLQQAFQANPIDAAQVQQAQAQVDALRGQILQARVDEALQIKALVGAEAFTKLLDALKLPEMGPRPF